MPPCEYIMSPLLPHLLAEVLAFNSYQPHMKPQRLFPWKYNRAQHTMVQRGDHSSPKGGIISPPKRGSFLPQSRSCHIHGLHVSPSTRFHLPPVALSVQYDVPSTGLKSFMYISSLRDPDYPEVEPASVNLRVRKRKTQKGSLPKVTQ